MALGQRPSLLWNRMAPSLSDPRFIRGDRYAIYDRMRATHPVFWDAPTGAWVVTGHAAAMAVLRDPRLKANRWASLLASLAPEDRETYAPLIASLSRFLLFLDEPDHPRIRSLIHKAFTPRRIDAMRDHMQDVVNALLDDAEEQGGMDVMADFAYRLPTTVIAEMLGIPPKHHEQFRRWTEGLAIFLGEINPSLEELRVGLASMEEMTAYFRKALKRVRRKPGEDLLSALAQAEEVGNVLSEEEILSTAILLLAAGHETTASLVGSGTLLLLQHPEACETLRANPRRMAGAVEEMLRMESPIQVTGREAGEAMEVAGRRVDAGDLLLVTLGGANRDPAEFADPHRFDIDRADNRHLAFSHGAHYCLGAMLARAEAQVALSTLVTRFPDLHAESTEGAWRRSQVFRGLARLPVTFRR